MPRITVRLHDEALQALFKLAETEHRHPREQAAYLIHRALVQYGLLEETCLVFLPTVHSQPSDQVNHGDTT